MDVIVVGGGVIGLSTATCLQESGFAVRILAESLPRETTSSVAAAIWYPYRAYPENRVLDWGRTSFDAFRELSEEPKSGVQMRRGVELFREPLSDPWWKSVVSGFRRCSADELMPGYEGGVSFTVPVIEMPLYLEYLLERFIAAGGSLERRAVFSLEEAGEGSRAVINCTGLGSRRLLGDSLMTPIRGQIVRVSNPGLERFTLDENPASLAYIVPRSKDCVLGGTAEEGRWDPEPDPETAKEIVCRCIALEPRLSRAEVLEHRVGLRPGRPEVRLETAPLPNGTPCVHNYGHGGSGVTLSWGCAKEVLGLLRQALGGRV